MNLAATIADRIGTGRIGAEILGGPPTPGLSPAPCYIALSAAVTGPTGVKTLADSPCQLPFRNNCLDYFVASDVLHRLANPVAALAEWYRVLRPEGLLCLTLPDRRRTADRARELTTVEHLLDDYRKRVSPADPSHIDEFVYESDWTLLAPEINAADLPGEKAALARRLHESAEQNRPIDIPFHTFEPPSIAELFQRVQHLPGFPLRGKIVDQTDASPEFDPTRFLVIVQVAKGWLARAESEAFDIACGADRQAAINSLSPQSLAKLLGSPKSI